MPNFNTIKSARIVAVVACMILLYSIKFDIYQLGIPATPVYIILKFFYFCAPPVLFFGFNKVNIDKKIFICSMIWVSYAFIYTYFYAINYMIGSIQLTIVFTCILYMDRPQFLTYYILSTLSTPLAILYSKSPYGFGSLGQAFRWDYMDDYLSLQIATGLVYFTVTYPRIKKIKEELKFSNFGKASSFLLHEMQKPLDRIQNNGIMDDELESLKKTLAIAKMLQSNSLSSANITTFKLKELIVKTLDNYDSYIKHFKIKIVSDMEEILVKSDKDIMIHLIDNLIRNAIEANKENPEASRWLQIYLAGNTLSITNPYETMIAESDLFLPLKSSKDGNMGTGLYFCKSITESLKHSLKIKCNNNIFEAKLTM